ncbi:hypothetical protein [Vibrio cholerae]|uniref:hypothetical protein n=1 Tax=Vibrio cholerae TaxID=666 RepID=UPI0004E33632|nr:hypothetical protein [Vibrio cholerae]ELZ1193143.1 hypothetical protein [Vibrio cholerae]KFD84594.1 hypothetical protein DN41_1539 [Vibrio cholerae]GHZ61382.1 hypothetical protein VCSRO80_2606 [Vibrio cholerae]
MMTEKGLAILDGIKAKHFPNGYREHKQGGQDFRFSRRGQIEMKRAAQARAHRLMETMK